MASAALEPSAAAIDDRAIRLGDQLVDQRWRALAALEMGLHGGDRGFRKHECGAAQLSPTRAAERMPRKSPQAGLEALRLIGHAALERRRPFAVNEIVAAVEQEQPSIIQS